MQILFYDMNIYISDNEDKIKVDKNDIFINEFESIKSCVGCFKCWTNKNNKCVFRDSLYDIPEKILNCNKIILISKISYGCYSSNIKKTLERIISVVKPFFTIRENEIHHILKSNNLNLQVYVYGEVNKNCEKIFEALIIRNAKNLGIKFVSIKYFENFKSIKEYIESGIIY